jgi:epsin
MLRQFHFIDLNGKDQGINVRNRSKELVELLSDVDKIRTERKKSRANRAKYGGYEGGGGGGGLGAGGMGSGSRMGGFGSESAGYGQYNGAVYGDGGGFGGQESSSSDYQDTQARRDRFEEYDEYDEGAASTPGRKKANSITSSPTSVRRETQKAKAPAKAPAKPKEPEEDLFDFGDEPIVSSSNSKAPAFTPAASSGLGVLDAADDDDDFDDFQSAAPPAAAAPTTSIFSIAPPASTSSTTSSTQFAAPQPRSGSQGQTINDLFASVSPPPPRTGSTASSAVFTPLSSAAASTPQMQPFKAPQPANYQASGPNYFQSVPLASPAQSSGKPTPTTLASLGKPSAGAAPKSGGGDAFASLLGGAASKKGAAPTKGASMADLARQKTSAGIWGTPGAAAPAASTSTPGAVAQPAQQQKLGGGLDDLLG